MSEYGRQPRDCKVLFSTSIVLGETVGEAREKKERLSAGVAANLDARLAALSFLSGLDFSKFDLDQPLPEVKTNASRSLTELYTSGTGQQTLRQMLLDPSSGGIDFVGTPDSVAAEMGEAMREIGGDGFLVTENLTRRTISEIADGLAPRAREAPVQISLQFDRSGTVDSAAQDVQAAINATAG